MEEKPSAAAISQAQTGRAEGFEELLKRYGQRLFGYFLRATGSYHDAEDLLGEMTLRLVRQIKSYDDHGRFEPWLFRIAANLVRDRIRRRKANPTRLSLSAEDESGQSLADDLPDRPSDVADGLMAREMSHKLQQAMNELDETTRNMILLRHFGGLSFKEIADTFDCPLGTALAKVHRGLTTLKKRLEGHKQEIIAEMM
ncbi:MAG: sigma-70 family RNA polymerase sigma factor [Planctomycetes bacterium]|nr:sigma-70 family RNA polymerase sigma factor [Planctomycetota bacterium]